MPRIHWTEAGERRSARWLSTTRPTPRRVVVADDRMRADTAHRLARSGTALLWRGDFHGARQLLRALARRCDRAPAARGGGPAADPAADPAAAFHRHRRDRARRARILGMLLVELDAGYALALRRAPDTGPACALAFGPPGGGPNMIALKDLLGAVGAAEWRRKGVAIPALGGDPIHPHYGVFSPVRGEYVDLVADAPLPVPSGGAAPGTSGASAPLTVFDIGTGTGVLAAVLARRGAGRVVATDISPRARECARENLDRLGLGGRAEVVAADLFPEGRAGLVVCNPPWVPAEPTSTLEQGVYDPDGRMLRGFLGGLAGHLEPGGEGWLILSDLAEHLGLRTRAGLLAEIEAAGLRVAGRTDTRPRHRRAADPADPLHRARAAETTSLWRLRVGSA
ncbi:methyltransferase [Nocardiopsis sediminis]|uniref:Methyltransferase n=1 Tax=Nocardiopsis sediminis TaxID=1778267 RepID=A0ABV8FS25_9ACTN